MTEQNANIEPKSVFYTSRDGLKLHARVYGEPTASGPLPVICLPGLSRNARDFDLLARTLASDNKNERCVVAFDYRGRGLSDYDKDWQNYNVLVEAEDVINGMAALGIEHGVFIGTSRGGLITFVLAGMRPGLMKAVVLNDIGPKIEGNGLMQIRGYLERAPKPKSWDEAIEIQKSIMAKSFPAFTDAEWKFEVESRYSLVNGILKADYDPNLAKTMGSVDTRTRLPTAWPQFSGLKNLPVLAIRGENSSILASDTLGKMKEVHPTLQVLSVSGQGHAPMLHTSTMPSTILEFCRRADSQSH